MDKTITIKLPLSILAGCYDLIEQAQVTVVGATSHTEVVEIALTAFITQLQNRGALPIYDSNTLRTKFRIREQLDTIPSMDDIQAVPPIKEARTSPADNVRPVYERPHSEHSRLPDIETNSSREVFELAQRIEREILGESDPEITEDVTISEAPAISNAPSTINLYKLPARSDASLIETAPKDRFVVLIQSKEAHELVKQAIRVLYNSLPLELWGSKIAESQINLLIQRHDGSDS